MRVGLIGLGRMGSPIDRRPTRTNADIKDLRLGNHQSSDRLKPSWEVPDAKNEQTPSRHQFLPSAADVIHRRPALRKPLSELCLDRLTHFSQLNNY